MRSGYWQDLTTADFDSLDLSSTVAVLPVAAIEQHGPHLPLSTDAIINAGLIEQMLAILGKTPTVLVMPPLSVGYSLEHTNFPGTLCAEAETLLALWCGIGRDVARVGIRKLAILNTHGGQKALVDLAALRLRAECGIAAARANYFSFGMPEGLFQSDEIAHGIHGGEVETSMMLHLAPELVRKDALRDFASRSSELARSNSMLGIEKPVGIGWLSEDLNTDGVCGNAAGADADRGRQYLEYLARRFVILLEELAALELGSP